jgi:hypothetical protein
MAISATILTLVLNALGYEALPLKSALRAMRVRPTLRATSDDLGGLDYRAADFSVYLATGRPL